MPGIFSRLKSKDFDFTRTKSKKVSPITDLVEVIPQKPKWEDAYTRKTVDPEEVQELVRHSIEEIKSRGLDQPLLLLPFRPASNPSAVRTFIRTFFSRDRRLSGDALKQDLRLTDPMVLTGVVKWCWSRLQGGVVGWDAYELFKVGEYDSNMARDSFRTFIPLSVDNRARQQLIFDFFSLMAAVAANSKANGLGGNKLSRMAAWWAFEHKDTGHGFDGGYAAWQNAADATNHLFYAYLRSMAPEKLTGIELLPRSLQKMLQESEYPPQRPEKLTKKTKKVVMIVSTVSSTPFALLRRANHFQYRDTDYELQAFSELEDPVQALTDECHRVLKAISAANQSLASTSVKHSTSLREASWSRFEDIGFASGLDEEEDDESAFAALRQDQPDPLEKSATAIGNELMRPTTPSWADFLSSGFVDDSQERANLSMPHDKVLPPINVQNGRHSSQSHRVRIDSELEPGELASIRVVDLDDTFWWVWMSSLAPEETADRKSAFGRCALVETKVAEGQWIIMEEMVQGAAPDPEEGAYIVEKKGFFSWTKRARTISRRKSTTSRKTLEPPSQRSINENFNSSRTSIGPDAHARIQAKAAQMRASKSQQTAQTFPRHGRSDSDVLKDKTHPSGLHQPNIAGEASSALNWVKKYDKGSIKDAYMSNANAGKGTPLASDSDITSLVVGSQRRVSTTDIPARDPANASPLSEQESSAPTPPPKDIDTPVAVDDAKLEVESQRHLSKISTKKPSDASENAPSAYEEAESQFVTPVETAPVTRIQSLAGVAVPTYEPSVADSATNVESDDGVEAKTDFSRFDQGPLADQPAFVPEQDSADQAAEAPVVPIKKVNKELTQKTGPGIQDRWAQIRKNAADRATARPSEEQSYGKYSKTADGDDDTSGEETIESRVARIKARVAELTGNMEGTSGPAQAAALRH